MFLCLFTFSSLATFSSADFTQFFDTSLPVVKRGAAGSYFGYSVAQHRTPSAKNWLLVGAPLGSDANSPGELWRCPVTMLDNDCEKVLIEDELALEELQPGGWFGGTLSSHHNSSGILVCAHRHLSKNFSAPGICYTFYGDFRYRNMHQPCRNIVGEYDYVNGYCQFGTSGMIADDTMIIGSPGSDTWKGKAYSYNLGEEVSDNHVDMTDNSDLQHYSYEGMAVGAGDLFGTGTIYITGAPRGKGYNGNVRLYRKNKNRSMYIMEKIMTIKGEQFGSQFGYQLATADLNGDGYLDLLVGAPNYVDKMKSGSVYVYINNGSTIEPKYTEKITGSSESRFGISIANLGDLNKNGCDSIAVGSPYNDDGGMVYIYSGTESGKLQLEQVISGRELGLSSFGYSLSGGLDMDKDSSQDLLVGSYESNTVVLFRSRPIYEISTSVNSLQLTSVNPNNKNCFSNGQPTSCFPVEMCFEISIPQELNELKLSYLLEADTNNPVKRVWISDSNNTDFPGQISVNVQMYNLDPPFVKKCLSHTVSIKKNWGHVRTPIHFLVTYIWKNITLENKNGSDLPSLDLFPGFTPKNYRFQATFLPECEDNTCYSQLAVISNITNLIQEGIYWTLHLETDREILLSILIENQGENAYNIEVYIKYNSEMPLIVQETKHQCSLQKRGQLKCKINDNPLGKMKSTNIILRFDSSKIEHLGVINGFNITWNTTSKHDESIPIEMKLNASRTIRHPYFNGKGEPNEIMFDVDKQNNASVNFTFEVEGNDNWPLHNVSLHIYLPSILVNGNLNFTNHFEIGGYTNEGSSSCLTPIPVDIEGNKKMLPNKNESKLFGENQQELRCDEDTWDNCNEIICSISNLKKNNIFKTLIKTKLPADSWKIYDKSNVTITIFAKIFIEVEETERLEEGINRTEASVTVRVRTSDEQTQPIWPYTLGVFISILIMSPIIFLLFKIGFFKRKSRDGVEEKMISSEDEMLDE